MGDRYRAQRILDIVRTGSESATTVLAEAAGLLSAFVCLPTAELVASINDGSVAESFGGIGRELGIDDFSLDRAWVASAEGLALRGKGGNGLSELRCEYTRLFAHPKGALVEPYESAFCASTEAGHPLLAVNSTARELDELYRRCGVTLNTGETVAKVGDHIGSELAVFSLLLERGVSGEEAARVGACELYERHGTRWWGLFFRQAASLVECPAYLMALRFGSELFGDIR